MKLSKFVGMKASSVVAVAAVSLTGIGVTTVATMEGAHAAECVTSQRVKIKEGKRGIDSVNEAQCRLNKVGYQLKVDGVFGKSTTDAVKDFQGKNGLGADGVVGPQTWKVLVEKSGGGGGGDTSSRDAKVATVVDYARQQKGKTYKRGAVGPSQFDCSGLTQSAFKLVGVTLARKSTAQHQGFTEVAAGDRLPGDLIWWTGKEHVGIYAGDDKIIDASSSQGKVSERNVYSYDGKPARYFRIIP